MKYLKKFETAADMVEWQKSVDYASPNVCLVAQEVIYNAPSLRGVTIQHIDGTLYLIEEWTARGFSSEEANGVAIIDDLASFVIAKEDAGTGLRWSNTAELIEGVSVSASSSEFVYSGARDTSVLVELGISPAAQACADYTFPNGAKGYMPSAGELKVLNNNKTKAQEALTLIGGANMFNSGSARYYWSSSQFTDVKAWCWASRMGIQAKEKYTIDQFQGYARAFCAL